MVPSYRETKGVGNSWSVAILDKELRSASGNLELSSEHNISKDLPEGGSKSNLSTEEISTDVDVIAE